MRIAAGLLRGAFNLILSAYYALVSVITIANKQEGAQSVPYYEPDFEDDTKDMDYSLPPGLIEHHSQSKPDDD